MLPKTSVETTRLPKPVMDRIHRYAREGRVPQVSYEHGSCRLLAVANWQLPVALLRSPQGKFTEMCSAALAEWKLVTCKTSRRRTAAA